LSENQEKKASPKLPRADSETKVSLDLLPLKRMKKSVIKLSKSSKQEAPRR